MISTLFHMSYADDATYTCAPRTPPLPRPTNDIDRASPHTRGHRRVASWGEASPPTQTSRMSCMAKAMASIKASVEVSLHDFFDSIPNFTRSGPARSLKTTTKKTNTNRSRQHHCPPVSWGTPRESRKHLNHTHNLSHTHLDTPRQNPCL